MKESKHDFLNNKKKLGESEKVKNLYVKKLFVCIQEHFEN